MDSNGGTARPSKKLENKRHGLLYDLFRRLIVEKTTRRFWIAYRHNTITYWYLRKFYSTIWHE